MFVPPRVLSVVLETVEEIESWSETDGGFYDSYPFRWRVTMTVAPQGHGSHRTRELYTYNAHDIAVGDWVSDIALGLAVQIVEIETVDDLGASLTVIVEDVDRFNTLTGSDGTGIGSTGGEAIVYTLSDTGMPVLGPAPAALVGKNVAWSIDQLSRFSYRNLVQSYYRVEQPAHGLAVGDVVRIREDGVYEKVLPGSAIEGVVGVVNSVGVPGVNWFTYRPSGRVVKGVVPPLPGTPGNLIYLDWSGAYTAVRPNAYAKPIFIRLGAPDLGLQLDRNVDTLAPASAGYIAQTYVVNTLDERDALVDLNSGDQVKVRNMGNGEWAQFIYDDGAWVLTVTQDASHTDAETFEVTVTERGTYAIATVSAGSRVTMVTVTVEETFPLGANICVGTEAKHNLLMSADHSDTMTPGAYTSTPAMVFEGDDTDILVFVSAPAGQSGKAIVALSYT